MTALVKILISLKSSKNLGYLNYDFYTNFEHKSFLVFKYLDKLTRILNLDEPSDYDYLILKKEGIDRILGHIHTFECDSVVFQYFTLVCMSSRQPPNSREISEGSNP